MQDEQEILLRERYSGIQTDEFLADVRRLKEGEPLAYIIGHAPFLNTTIYLDSHPLIPRPETEYWTEKAIEDLKTRVPKARLLDLCAGSGCIGIAIAKALPGVHADFTEINKAHTITINRNVRENNIASERISVNSGDLFENVSGKYDCIVSNPPYIDPELASRAQSSVKKFEPAEALYGGERGLELIERIITETPARLNPGGTLYIEHEPEQACAVSLLAIQNSFASAQVFEDQYRTARFSKLVAQ